MYGCLYIPRNRTSQSKRMNAIGAPGCGGTLTLRPASQYTLTNANSAFRSQPQVSYSLQAHTAGAHTVVVAGRCDIQGHSTPQAAICDCSIKACGHSDFSESVYDLFDMLS